MEGKAEGKHVDLPGGRLLLNVMFYHLLSILFYSIQAGLMGDSASPLTSLSCICSYCCSVN